MDVAAEYLARMFHDHYERLAPSFDYAVRPDVGNRPFDALPANNRRLMVATASAVLADLHRAVGLDYGARQVILSRIIDSCGGSDRHCLRDTPHTAAG